ncbi:Pleckstrin homology domain-containing protein [Delphinella strobiligena]|nr:Pleckstrin homology domain-containing protein [Delphinella strobiligena]
MSAPETTMTPVETPAIVEPVAAASEETTVAPTEETVATTSTEQPATEATASEEPSTETTAETAAATEETPLEPAKAIESGNLGYKAPGLIKSFKFSKKHFWLGDEAIPHEKLNTYLRGEKPEIAHPAAAWSTQTGKGNLYFSKHVDDKSAPSGVLNLAEASDLEKQSQHEFSFKLHGHKHTFKATDDAERDGWYVSIEQAIAQAKETKESIVSSEGYKESLAHLGTPVFGGAAATTDATKTEEPVRAGSSSSSSEEESKKKEQARSQSRGNKRTSIFGNLLNKKEDHENKKEIKKEEKEEAKEEAKEGEEAKTEAPVEEAEAAAAPLDAEAVAARAVDAPVEEAAAEPAAATTTETVPAAEAANHESRPKPNKRSSIFGSFFEKVRSPAHEKKESEVGPNVPPKDTIVSAEPPVIPEPSTGTETTVEAQAPTVTEPAAPAVAETVPAKTEPSSPKKERQSFFGGIASKVRAKSPANIDRSLKSEEVKAESAPSTPFVVDGTTTTPVTTEAAPAEEPVSETTNTATTPKESRRKSYFGGGNKLSSIFRKPSQAVRNKEKKENAAPVAEEKAVAQDTPAATEETAATEATEAPAAIEEPQTANETVPDAAAVAQEHQASTTVSAAA